MKTLFAAAKAIAIFALICVAFLVVANGVHEAIADFQKRGAVIAAIDADFENDKTYTRITNMITKSRNDDFQHYCVEPRDKALDRLERSNAMYSPDWKSTMDYIFKLYGGECSAKWGWDNFEAPNSSAQYYRIMRPKIRDMWFGDKRWLEHRFCEEDHGYSQGNDAKIACAALADPALPR